MEPHEQFNYRGNQESASDTSEADTSCSTCSASSSRLSAIFQELSVSDDGYSGDTEEKPIQI
jgi:hypothetical protein